MKTTITELITRNGMPHWLAPIKDDVLTIVSENEIEVGDGFVFYSHMAGYDRKEAQVVRVTKVLESRDAKGNYDKPTFYYKLKTKTVVEDSREYTINVSK